MGCVVCRENGSRMCGGHCGLCFENGEIELKDGHPSARDHREDFNEEYDETRD